MHPDDLPAGGHSHGSNPGQSSWVSTMSVFTKAHQVKTLAQYWVNRGHAGCAGHNAQAGAARSVATSSTVRLQALTQVIIISVTARC